MNILIVEDEELYADQLEMLVEKLGYTPLGPVNSSRGALEILEQQIPDLILMDIQIKGSYDGVELTDMIHKRYPIPVIFITSWQDEHTYQRASRTGPVNFLAKPFDQVQMQRIIELSVKNLLTSEESKDSWEEDVLFKDHLFVKHRQKLVKIAIKDIFYVEADGRHCHIYMENRKFLVRISLVKLWERLPAPIFIQPHRSFLINTQKISSIDTQESVIYVNDFAIPLSKRHREHFLKQIDYL